MAEAIFDKEIIEWLLASQDAMSTSSSSDSSEESSEEEIPRKVTRTSNFVEVIVPQYSEKLFKEQFSMSRSTINYLIDKFSHHDIQPRYTNANINFEKSVLLFIWYLTNTESFRQVADRFNVALSSAHRVVLRVMNFILTLSEDYIKWPNRQEKLQITQEFEQKYGLVSVIGCIDGHHLKICKPKSDHESYLNNRGFHSVLVQGIVDSRKLFLNVYCGEPGSMHDATLLRRSGIYSQAENPRFFGDYNLLGDSAYPSLPWLVTPYKDMGNLTEEEKQLNIKLSSAHMLVKQTFGLLKSRFRRIKHFENLDLNVTVKLIMTACILHNLCILEDDSLDETT